MQTFGSAYAAVLGTHDGLLAQLTAAGDATDELVWRMPLVQRYRRQLPARPRRRRGPRGGRAAGAHVGHDGRVGRGPHARGDTG